MVTIGVDAHKRVHVAVAVDEVGRLLEEWEGANGQAAWQELLAWASRWEKRLWGIEGTGNYGKGLAQHLVTCGETVLEVNPRLTAAERRRARKRDKNDRLDAHAVAMAVLRNPEDLPVIVREGNDATAVLKELSCQRKRVTSQVTRMRSQLHDQLFHLDPDYKRSFPDLTRLQTVKELEGYEAEGSLLERVRAEGVRHAAQALRLEMERAEDLTGQMEELGKSYGALMEIEGVGAFRAGQLAGFLGTHVFQTDARFAAYAAAAPLEVSSAGQSRHRFNPGASRQLNSILYMIALTQSRLNGEGRKYIGRLRAEGRSWREAVRALKRFIARRIWQVWQRSYAFSRAAPFPGGRPLTGVMRVVSRP